MRTVIFILLSPFYLAYLCVIYIRNLLFDLNLLSVTNLNCKVISVGNLSMGGTGKTPMVIALAKALAQDYKIAILSRGYGRKTKGTRLVTEGDGTINDWLIVGDEPYMMSKNLPGVPIAVDADRARGGNYLVDNFNPDLIILDDAFQHRRIHRDIDLVLIDANKKSTFQFWRESLSALERADTVILTKGEKSQNLSYWKGKTNRLDMPIFQIKSSVKDSLVGLTNKQINIEQVQGKSVIVFSGIGNPQSFIKIVRQLNCKILDAITFKDHHQYTLSDISQIQLKYTKYKPDFILTTEKDLVKLPSSSLPIFAVPIQMSLTSQLVESIKNGIS